MQTHDQPVVWQGLYHRTLEFFTWRHDNNGHTMRSYITGMIDDTPAQVTYAIEVDTEWRTQRVAVDIQSTTPYSLSLQKQPTGHWHDASAQPIAGLQECTDVDISITPFTNTLAINRLKLMPGESEITNVLYIDLEARQIKAVQQQYTHLGPRHYRYASMDSGFSAEIRLDSQNLVLDYPDIWKRLYPLA